MGKLLKRLALVATMCGALVSPPAAAAPPPSIDPSALQAHLEFLADDLLQGREAGTAGFDVAALYVAAEFRALGLQPAGSDGFLQHVPLRRSVIVPGSVVLRISGAPRPFTDRDHVLAYPSPLAADEHMAGDLVFAGNGVVAPQFQRDDYAGLDVAGKIVVVLGGPPAGLPAEAAAHLGAAATQTARAAERGAVAIIVVWTPTYERRLSFARFADISRQAQFTWVDPANPALTGAAPIAAAFIDETAAEALFENAPVSYRDVLLRAEHVAPRGFDLGRRAEFSRRSQLSSATSANVAALLPGSDPRLRQEIVVVVAHLDHVGIGPAVNGDSIYNGAIDNASGVAATLEVARALRYDRPRRSVLFLAVTAEEKGLIGSDFFARRPTVARDRIVGAINLDGVMAFYDFQSIIGYGVESSTLREPLLRAARSMRLTLMGDPHPELSIFSRSDHYSFVRQGVPAVFLQMGEGPSPDGGSGLALSEAWDAAHLHQPSDEVDVGVDYAVFARFTELYRRFALETANMAAAPQWYEGDFLADAFAPGAARAPAPAR